MWKPTFKYKNAFSLTSKRLASYISASIQWLWWIRNWTLLLFFLEGWNPLLKLPRLSIVLFLSFSICLRDTGGLEDFSVPDLAPAYYIIQNGCQRKQNIGHFQIIKIHTWRHEAEGNKTKEMNNLNSGFVRVMKNVESHEIYEFHFPVLESHGI